MSLSRATERVLRRIHHLESKSARCVRLRTILFIATLGLGLTLEAFHLPRIAQGLTGVGVLAFIVSVFFHQRIKRTLTRFHIRHRLLERQAAVRNLTWEVLPALPPWTAEETLARHYFDLDLVGNKSLFRILNYTVSKWGFQRLVEHFSGEKLAEKELKTRQDRVRELGSLRLLRKRFLVAAEASGGLIDSSKLFELLGEKLDRGQGKRWFLMVWSAQIVAQILFCIAYFKEVPPYYALPVVLTLVLYRWAWQQLSVLRAYDYALALEGPLGKFSEISDVVLAIARAPKPELKALLQDFVDAGDPKPLIKGAARVMGALGFRQNYLVHLGIHLLVPWDLFWTLRLENLRLQLEVALPRWLKALSELEACVSLAEYAEAHPEAVFPQWEERATAFYKAEALRHPLIPVSKSIGNDFELSASQRCLIVTGSNMSGKSTFLRTVGVNLLLAQAGTVVHARSLTLKQSMGVETSLRLNDSLEDGFSAFYAEVLQLKHVLDRAEREGALLYLIDEVFRGTNNRERLLGSEAYIQKLATTPACGLVTTHDLELSRLAELNPAIRNYHFTESIEDDRMLFHYRLSEGPSSTTNALRVMRLVGLPEPSRN